MPNPFVLSKAATTLSSKAAREATEKSLQGSGVGLLDEFVAQAKPIDNLQERVTRMPTREVLIRALKDADPSLTDGDLAELSQQMLRKKPEVAVEKAEEFELLNDEGSWPVSMAKERPIDPKGVREARAKEMGFSEDVFFHSPSGGSVDITAFDKERGRRHVGMTFVAREDATTAIFAPKRGQVDPQMVDRLSYSKMDSLAKELKEQGVAGGAQVMPLRLNIKKPFEAGDIKANKELADELDRMAVEAGDFVSWWGDVVEEAGLPSLDPAQIQQSRDEFLKNVLAGKYKYVENYNVVEALKRLGYDAIETSEGAPRSGYVRRKRETAEFDNKEDAVEFFEHQKDIFDGFNSVRRFIEDVGESLSPKIEAGDDGKWKVEYQGKSFKGGPGRSSYGLNYGVFDPSNIRSAFAAFGEDTVGKTGLSLGVGGAGVISGVEEFKREAKKID